MTEYLDPSSDVVFKKIFMDHPQTLRGFLNALLPFETERQHVVEVSVLPASLQAELDRLRREFGREIEK